MLARILAFKYSSLNLFFSFSLSSNKVFFISLTVSFLNSSSLISNLLPIDISSFLSANVLKPSFIPSCVISTSRLKLSFDLNDLIIVTSAVIAPDNDITIAAKSTPNCSKNSVILPPKYFHLL